MQLGNAEMRDKYTGLLGGKEPFIPEISTGFPESHKYADLLVQTSTLYSYIYIPSTSTVYSRYAI